MANTRTVYDFSLAIGARIDSSFGRAVDRTADSMDNLGGRLSNAFDNSAGVALKSISAIGAAIGGLSVASALHMDDENRKLQAQLGATTQEMEGIRAASQAIFKTGMVEDISEANNIMLELNRTVEGLTEQDSIEIGAQMATLGVAFELDNAETTRAMDSMMKSFGVSGQEAMDYIAWGMQNNLDFSGEFLDTLNEYGPQFKDAGYSAQEMFAILKAGAEGGAWNLDKVGDAAKEFGLRIKDGSTGTNEAMAQLSKQSQTLYEKMLTGGGSTADVMGSIISELSAMEDQTKAFQLAQALFGTTGEDLTMDVLYNLNDIGAETIKTTGTMDEMAQVLSQGVGVQMKGALNTGKLALSDLGQEILVVVMPAIQAGIGAVEDLSSWFINLDDKSKRMIVTIGGVAMAIGPAILVVNGIGKAISVASVAVRGMGMAVAFFTSPVGIAVVAFGLLAAGAIYVATHAEELQVKFQEVGANIKSGAIAIKDTIVGSIGSAIDFVTDSLSNTGNMVGEFIKTPINVGIGFVNSAIDGVNGLSIDVPAWVPGVGGKTLGFNIPPIPALAQGGITTGATLAMVGEGKEQEAILPLSKLETLLKDKTGTMLGKAEIGAGFQKTDASSRELGLEFRGTEVLSRIEALLSSLSGSSNNAIGDLNFVINNHFDGEVNQALEQSAVKTANDVIKIVENYFHGQKRVSLGRVN